MNKPSTKPPRYAPLLLALLSLPAASCRDFGEGGTGERAVPWTTLGRIDRSDLSGYVEKDPAATQPANAIPGAAAPTSLPTTLPSTRPAVTFDLTLDEARALALENNLDLRVERFNPAVSGQTLAAERARFEAVFTTDARYTTFDTPTASRLQSGTGDSTSVTPGVRVPLQSGGFIDLDVPVNQQGNDNAFTVLNPSYTAGPGLTLSQPLLRGGGIDANAVNIRTAFYGTQQAQARTKLETIRVLANVDRGYWRLYAAQQLLNVRRAQFELDAALLQRNRRRFAANLDPEVEVLRAESQLADTLQAVQEAQTGVQQRERDLKRILSRPGLAMDTPTTLVLRTDPGFLTPRLDRDALIRTAILNRMELLDTELQVLADTARVNADRNGLLPLLSISYTYRVNGLGGSFEEAFAQAGANRYADNSIGASLEVPIGNEAARARLRQSLLLRMQTLASKAQRQAQVVQELLDALDNLDLQREKIVAARRRVLLNRRLLDAELRQLEAGLRTSTDVLDVQARLAAARSDEVIAVTEFQIAQVDTAFATGLVLGAGNVTWTAVQAPKVPRYIP